MGNICRSPTAHGVLEHQVNKLGLTNKILVDSAGTHNYHPDSPPDTRSQRHAIKRGYDLSQQRARQVQARDFEEFDLIVAMDMSNLAQLKAKCPTAHKPKLKIFTAFLTQHDAIEVPDPYYGGDAGFEYVLDLVEDGCQGIVRHFNSQVRRDN
jgi:protein-tyrosine phosphatase